MQEIESPIAEENVVIQAQVSGATNVELMVRVYSFDSQFTSVPMYDDGQHGDNDANDTVYGATIPFQSSSHVKYFIRATNNDALILSPRKAEYEFFKYSID